VCVTLRGRDDGGTYTIQRVSLVKRDGLTLNGVDEAQAKLTFGAGTWDDGAAVGSGTTVKSNFESFDLVTGEDLFLTFWVSPGNKTVLRKVGGQVLTWTTFGSDESTTVDWEGLSISETRRQVFAAFQLDVLTNP